MGKAQFDNFCLCHKMKKLTAYLSVKIINDLLNIKTGFKWCVLFRSYAVDGELWQIILLQQGHNARAPVFAAQWYTNAVCLSVFEAFNKTFSTLWAVFLYTIIQIYICFVAEWFGPFQIHLCTCVVVASVRYSVSCQLIRLKKMDDESNKYPKVWYQ